METRRAGSKQNSVDKDGATPEKPTTKTPSISRKKTKLLEEHDIESLQNIANMMRIQCLEMTQAANSGHPTSCSSSADFMACLFFDKVGMHYDPKNPGKFTNDRLVLSKGHIAPLLYAAWSQAGYLDKADLNNLRKIDSDLEGHPMPKQPFVDVATGSLGQGLGVAAGLAYSSKYFDKLDNYYFAMMGDAEIQEGSIWEACNFASQYNLDNLVGFVDCNKYGQSNILGHPLQVYKKRFEAFGWNAIVVDGHKIEEIIVALDKARKNKGSPTIIIGKTFKGRNFGEGVEDNMHFHGKPLGGETPKAIEHLRSLITNFDAKLEPTLPEMEDREKVEVGKLELKAPEYAQDKEHASRAGYGNALTKLGDVDEKKTLVGLDADLKNSTYAEYFFKAHPDMFIECFIEEQNMVSVACGVVCRGRVAFCSTFAAFLSRAFDQMRMAAMSELNLKFCGSHCGISIGEDGASQMALEDLSMFRSLPNSTVLYPTDVVAAERAVELAYNTKGVFYIRTGRQPAKILYSSDEKFEVGKCKVQKKSDSDKLCVVGAGVTLYEALKAAETLAGEGINIRVIDLFSVKPVDREGLVANAKECNNTILTVEDHYFEGGILDAVCAALGTDGVKVCGLAVNRIPKSGKAHELFELCGISAKHICEKVKTLI